MTDMDSVGIAINRRLLKWIVFVLPLGILAFLITLRVGDERLYYFLMYEDHTVEVLSAIVYAVSTGMAIYVACGLFRLGQKWLFFCYALIALGLFFITGEEISWGQRILGIASPEYFLENSSQQEINIHNLKPVQAILHKIYIVIGLLGAILWLGLKLSKAQGKIFNRWLIPNWYLCLYFLPVAIFYSYYDFVRPVNDFLGVTGRDQEPNEFLMCLGFFLLVLENFLRMRQIQNKPESHIISIKLDSKYTVPHG